MKLGIFAKTFAGETPQAVLQAASGAGFGAVQYNMACSGIGSLPQVLPSAFAAEVRAAAQATGVEIAAVSATYNMIHPDMTRRLAGRASFAAIAAQAGAMGTRLLTVCSGSCDANDQWRHHPDNGSDAAWVQMLVEFGHLIRIAEVHDVLIGVEPELANVVDGAVAARRMIDTLASDRIRIVLDPANLFEVDEGRDRVIAEAVDMLGDRIAMAHAKDRNADGSFAVAGKGVVDFGHFIGRLKQVGFDGTLVTHGLTASEAAGVAAYLAGLV